MGSRRRYVFFFIGMALAAAVAYLDRPVVLSGVFFDGAEREFVATAEEVRDTPTDQRVVAEVSAAGVPAFRALLYVTDMDVSLSVGDIFSARAYFGRSGRYDGVPHIGLRGLSEKALRISATALVEPSDISVLGYRPSLRAYFAGLRERVALQIYSSGLSPEASALLVASCLGTSDAPVGVKERFQATGLAHLLCVSGFHVGLVAALCMMVLLPLRLIRNGWAWAYIITLGAVWGYAALTGLQPSAMRAAIMLTCIILAKVLQRGMSSVYSLGLAVMIILVVNPYWIFSPGFLLSVGAVAGILMLGGRLNPVPPEYLRCRKVAGLFTIPLAAMLGTAPLVLAMFHKLPLLTVPVNAFAAMIFPAFMCAGCVYVVLCCLGLPCAPLASAVDWLRDVLMRICDYGGRFELADIYLSPLSLAALVVALILFVSIFFLRKNAHRLVAVLGVLATVAVCACSGGRTIGRQLMIDGSLYSTTVYLLDGDSACVYTSGGRDYAMKFHSDYFAGHGFEPDEIPVFQLPKDGVVHWGGLRIGYAAKTDEACLFEQGIDYLIIDRRFRGDCRKLVHRLQPRNIIAGYGRSDSIVNELKVLTSETGIPLAFLPDRIVYTSDTLLKK